MSFHFFIYSCLAGRERCVSGRDNERVCFSLDPGGMATCTTVWTRTSLSRTPVPVPLRQTASGTALPARQPDPGDIRPAEGEEQQPGPGHTDRLHRAAVDVRSSLRDRVMVSLRADG